MSICAVFIIIVVLILDTFRSIEALSVSNPPLIILSYEYWKYFFLILDTFRIRLYLFRVNTVPFPLLIIAPVQILYVFHSVSSIIFDHDCDIQHVSVDIRFDIRYASLADYCYRTNTVLLPHRSSSLITWTESVPFPISPLKLYV